jgi:phage/plasmid-associated DNA primase
MTGTQKNNDAIEITQLLEDERAESGTHHTHVSMRNPKGSFRLSRANLDKLNALLCRYNEESFGSGNFGLAEKGQGNFLPILVDVDLKVPKEVVSARLAQGNSTDRVLYSMVQIKELVTKYQSILRNICEQDMDDKLLACVVLEKPMYTQDVGETSYVKNGFHLHFPFLFLDRKYIRVHVTPAVQSWMDERALFEDIGMQDANSIIDSAVSNDIAWLMYGCKKEGSGMSPYKATCVINYKGDTLSLADAFDGCQIFDSDAEPIAITKENVVFHLPRILSIRCTHRKLTAIRNDLVPPSILRENMPSLEFISSRQEMNSNPTKDLETASQIIKFIAQHRTETYIDWMKIGWILCNISGRCREAFELWDEFSKRSTKYDATLMEDTWNHMDIRKKPGLASLIWFAKTDSPSEFKKWQGNNMESKIMESIQTGGTHNDLARMMHSMYRTMFACSSVSSKKWFQFIDHAWEEIEEGTYLRAKLSDPHDGLVGVYQTQIEKQRAVLAAESDEAAKEMHNFRIKAMNKIILNLKHSGYKNNVMRECTEVFYDKTFSEKLNLDRMLVAFDNGVYDLSNNTFRDGLPEDYISIKMPVKYRKFHRTDEKVKQVEMFFEQVFPDPTVKKYFLDVYSEIFEGGNSRKVVVVWTGNGDNGKSITQKLLELMLGRLSIKFSTTLLSGKKQQTGSATPELARAKPPVRLAVMDEPNHDEKLNCGLMKQLSGGDSFSARDLFEKGSQMQDHTPYFTLTILCNGLPALRHPDKATWNRIKVIPFESTFVDGDKKCPDTYEEQLRDKCFPKDPNFTDKIPGMLEALSWFLLQHRAGWPDEDGNRTEFLGPMGGPAKVQQATREYARQNDLVRQFIDTEYEQCDDLSKKVRQESLWNHFKEWWGMNHTGSSSDMPVTDSSEFVVKVNTIWKNSLKFGSSTSWSGYKACTSMHANDDFATNEDLML